MFINFLVFINLTFIPRIDFQNSHKKCTVELRTTEPFFLNRDFNADCYNLIYIILRIVEFYSINIPIILIFYTRFLIVIDYCFF